MARPSRASSTPQGNHVGFERVDRASVVEDGVSPLLDEHPARRRRPAAQPLRARRALRLRHRRLRREPGLLRPRLLRHRPALRPLRRGATTTRRAGRPTCAPGTRCSPTARPRSTRRCCTTAGPSARSSTASTSARSTARPTPRPRSSSTTGSRWRPERGSRPQVLPTKEKGAWTGTLFVDRADQQAEPASRRSTIEHDPPSLRSRAPARSPGRGDLDRQLHASTGSATAPARMYEGPEVFGNATSYGRALFTAQHLVGADARGVEKIRGREVLIDADTRELAVVWQLFHGETTTHFVHGLAEPGRPVSLSGRVVVVTGGTRGIGLGLARELLARDCRVVVCGRSAAVGRHRGRRAPGGGPDRATGLATDVTSRVQCRRCGTTPSPRSDGSTSGSTTPACSAPAQAAAGGLRGDRLARSSRRT